jgi:dUTP pyrophosphatase
MSKNTEVKIKFLENNNLKKLPVYATDGSAGMDFYACGNYELLPGDVRLVRTGIALEIPNGYELQIRSRSGLALKNHVFVLNAPGTIDSDYRGEVGVIICNLGPYAYRINEGDRIAQGVLCEYEKADLKLVEDISTTERSVGGFGSTGTK